MKKHFIIFCVMLLLCGCNKNEVLYLYSPDKTQCITVFSDINFRYIVNGKHRKLPKTEFVKIDIQNVDPLGDQLYVCWKSKYHWDITINKSEVLESKLDSSKFHFNTRLPLDERGIPTEIKYRGENCAIFDFYRMKLSPDKGAIVEY